MTSKSWNYGGGVNDPLKSVCNAGGPNSVSYPLLTENPYSLTLLRFSRTLNYDYDHGVLVYGSPSYVYWGLLGAPKPWTANDSNTLLSKLVNEIRGHDFNAAIFAAEGRESLTTVTNSSRAVAGMFKSVCRLDYKGVLRSIASLPGQVSKDRAAKIMAGTTVSKKAEVSRALKQGDVSGAWLSLRYGWEPLIQDVYEAAKAVEHLTLAPRKVEYRAKHSSYGSAQQWDDKASTAYNVLPAQGKITCKYKVVFYEKVSLARSLGLLNPAAVVWEKIPFSFVVDWFIPIGTYLDNVSFLPAISGNTTYVYSSFAIANADGKKACKSWPEIQRINVGGAWSSLNVKFDRTVGTWINPPRPEFNSWKKAMGTKHLQNAAALIHQVVGGMVNSRNVAARKEAQREAFDIRVVKQTAALRVGNQKLSTDK